MLEQAMKTEDITTDTLGRLNTMPAEELIAWAIEKFGDRAAIGTSFQLTGSVIIDLAARRFKSFRVFTIDTLRLHPESYATLNDFEKRYGLAIELFQPNNDKLEKMVSRFGEYLFFMDKAKQEYCCDIRKVEPNERALDTLDVWITGLRKDQSEGREAVARAEIIEHKGRKILKLAPLADWTAEEVRGYIDEHHLPYNTLFDKGYDSIGCIICSTPLLPGEPPRAGRWRWFNALDAEHKKECGIHVKKQ